ncbi:MAG: hypothetical protein ABMA15_27925, partial [Vicinamibacterales bacterium]
MPVLSAIARPSLRAALCAVAVGTAGAATFSQVDLAGQSGAASQATFTRDIAPILQRSCQNCHRP